MASALMVLIIKKCFKMLLKTNIGVWYDKYHMYHSLYFSVLQSCMGSSRDQCIIQPRPRQAFPPHLPIQMLTSTNNRMARLVAKL